MTALRIGFQRGLLEIKQFNRAREAVVFTIAFPVILLFIFGSVFNDEIAPGVTFSQYFVAGMIASGLVNSGFQNLAITIPMERDTGALKRLRGTPMPPSAFFIGKGIQVLYSMSLQVVLLLGFGALLLRIGTPHRGFTMDRLRLDHRTGVDLSSDTRHRLLHRPEEWPSRISRGLADRDRAAILQRRLLRLLTTSGVDAAVRSPLPIEMVDAGDEIRLPS